MGKAIYAIDAFPDDAQLWRIDWIGGVAYNASVPSEPLIGKPEIRVLSRGEITKEGIYESYSGHFYAIRRL